MKISIFTKSINVLGGVEAVVDKHCEWILKSNNEINVLSLKNYSYDHLKKIDYKFIKKCKIIQTKSLFDKSLGFKFIFNAHKLFLNSEKTIIHLPFILGLLSLAYYFLLSKITTKRISNIYIYNHTIPSNNYFLRYVYIRLLRIICFLLPQLKIIISENSIENKYVFRKLKNPIEIIRIPYNNILSDENKNETTKEIDFNIKKIKKYLSKYNKTGVFIGRIAYCKGITNLLKSIKFIDQNIGIIISGSGDFKSIYKKLTAQELDLINKRVLIINDYIPAVLKRYLLNNCDFFLFPSISKTEAYGIAQIEALNYGLPIINAKLDTAVNEIVKDMIHGCTCKETNNPIALAKSITKIVNLINNNYFDKKEIKSYVSKNFSEPIIEQNFNNTLLN